MPREESVIGSIGVILIATRGTNGPGEVLVKIRGGSEARSSRTPSVSYPITGVSSPPLIPPSGTVTPSKIQ